MGIKDVIGSIFIMLLVAGPNLAMADKSDYIWNRQFAKKMGLAEQGDAKAQYDVGKMLQKGQGTARDAAEAFKWFSKAADQGHVRAGYKVGYLYHKGAGVKKNDSKAFQWIKRSADKGYAPAMFYLGKFYATGAGTRKDLNQALAWYKKAAGKGYYPAKGAVKTTQQKIAAAAPPPPPRRAAAPAPKRAAPAPKRTKRSAPSDAKILAALISNTWLHKGKPAAEFPSAKTECSVNKSRIICNSGEMDIEEPYGVVTYKVEASIGDFEGNQFSNQYRRNVTLIFPNDPDNPNVVIPIDYGPQPTEEMRCKMVGKGRITCTTQDNKTITYKKS